jgi:hypothetical protein
MTDAAGNGAGDDRVDLGSQVEAKRRVESADRRMADAEALLEVASAQLAVAARNIASANSAEREYRRAVWHYTQLMKHRISNPLQTIIGMADTLRDMPDLEQSRRQAMIEAIGQQARVLRDASLEPRVVAETERVLRPQPSDAAVHAHHSTRGDVEKAQTGELPIIRKDGSTAPMQSVTGAHVGEQPAEQQARSPFTRFGHERWIDPDSSGH